MATTRSLMNKVLRGLRQFDQIIADDITEITDNYLLMQLQHLNEAKEELEDSGWPWYALRATVTVTLAAGTADYTLTSAGDADTDTNDRSRLLYENNVSHESPTEGFYETNASLPQVFNVTDSNEYRLRETPLEKMERWHFTDNDEQGKPTDFALYAATGNLKLKVYPTPDQAYTLKLRLYIPQAELADDDITTTLTIPERPVWMKALLKANQERGDELGREGSTLWTAYLDAHGAAVASEMTLADQTVFLDR